MASERQALELKTLLDAVKYEWLHKQKGQVVRFEAQIFMLLLQALRRKQAHHAIACLQVLDELHKAAGFTEAGAGGAPDSKAAGSTEAGAGGSLERAHARTYCGVLLLHICDLELGTGQKTYRPGIGAIDSYGPTYRGADSG